MYHFKIRFLAFFILAIPLVHAMEQAPNIEAIRFKSLADRNSENEIIIPKDRLPVARLDAISSFKENLTRTLELDFPSYLFPALRDILEAQHLFPNNPEAMPLVITAIFNKPEIQKIFVGQLSLPEQVTRLQQLKALLDYLCPAEDISIVTANHMDKLSQQVRSYHYLTTGQEIPVEGLPDFGFSIQMLANANKINPAEIVQLSNSGLGNTVNLRQKRINDLSGLDVLLKRIPSIQLAEGFCLSLAENQLTNIDQLEDFLSIPLVDGTPALTRLRSLSVRANNITNFPKFTKSAPMLVQLELSDNRLTSLSSITRATFPALHCLSVLGNANDLNDEIPWLFAAIKRGYKKSADLYKRENTELRTACNNILMHAQGEIRRARDIAAFAAQLLSDERNKRKKRKLDLDTSPDVSSDDDVRVIP